MDRGVWWATVQGAAESDMTEPLSTHAPMQGNSVCAIDISSDARNFHLSTPTKVKVKSLSRVRLFATPWTVAYQAPLSMRFSRQEYWSGLPFPSPGDLCYPGIESGSPALEADALTSEPPGKPLVD